jgi:hypothetical protein
MIISMLLLKRASFFKAIGAVAKIGLSLKLNQQNLVELEQILA